MKFINQGEVLNFREFEYERCGLLTGQYAHVVDDKIYYQVHDYPSKPAADIFYAEYNKEKNKYIKSKNNCVIKKSLAGQNFRAFKDISDKNYPYKAIAGFHTNKDHALLKDCQFSKEQVMVKCPNPVWPEEKTMVFAPEISHPRHANGLYVFKSKDGINWELFHNKPIINRLTECKNLPIGTHGQDSFHSIFFDDNKEKYVLYIRANIKLGVRHVLYTESKNLIDWSVPELIQSNPPFNLEHDNFYYGSVYKYEDIYVAFTPFFENYILDPKGHHREYKNEKTLLMVSKNGTSWNTVDELFEHNNSNPEWGGHMRAPHVLSFDFDDENIMLYVQKNFLTYKNKLMLYTIRRKDFDQVVRNK